MIKEEKQKVLKIHNTYRFISEFEIIDMIPNQYYELDWDKEGCFLRQVSPPVFPKKIYSVDQDFRNRIKKSFEHYDKNVGVVLKGQKGTGKSLCAQQLCVDLGLPVVMITRSIPLTIDFISFLNQFQQQYILFIDEFEKRFGRYGNVEDNETSKVHDQTSFLSFMDGMSTGPKKLFLFTTNSDVGEFLINRPSRVKFYKEYVGIAPILVEEIVKDRLSSFPEHAQDLINNLSAEKATIDILMSIIDEILVHDIPYTQFKDEFNFSLDDGLFEVWEVINNRPTNLLTTCKMFNVDSKHPYDLFRFSKALRDKYKGLDPCVTKNINTGMYEITFDDNTAPVLLLKPFIDKFNVVF